MRRKSQTIFSAEETSFINSLTHRPIADVYCGCASLIMLPLGGSQFWVSRSGGVAAPRRAVESGIVGIDARERPEERPEPLLIAEQGHQPLVGVARSPLLTSSSAITASIRAPSASSANARVAASLRSPTLRQRFGFINSGGWASVHITCPGSDRLWGSDPRLKSRRVRNPTCGSCHCLTPQTARSADEAVGGSPAAIAYLFECRELPARRRYRDRRPLSIS